MLKSVWVGGAALAVLFAPVARADGPAKAKEGPEPTGHRVIVQAVEGQPGGTIEVQVVPGKPKVVRMHKVLVRQPEGKKQPGAPGKAVELRVGDEKRRGVWLDVPKPPGVSDYWIGLECYSAEPALGAQLKLPEGQGLVIHHVAPDSPAAKAGLKQHDVVVKAGGKPVADVADLIEAVEAAKDKKLSLEIIREAKPKKIDVKPVKRPKEFFLGDRIRHFPLPAPGNPDFEALRKWYEQMKPGVRPPMQFRFFQPGMILPPGAPVHPPLPGNMSVAITKQGEEPAKIVVSKDGKKWEVTEKELDKLPKDVRPHVERMLGRIPPAGPGDLDFDIDVDIVPPTPVPDRQLKKELDQMHRQIEELRKAVEHVQDKTSKPKKPKSR